jgi:hypothetical protein
MGILKHVKWGKVLDVTLTIAGIAVPLISGRRQEAKAKEEMVKSVREEVRRQLGRKHHG